MQFNEHLQKYWPSVSDQGLEEMSNRFTQALQIMTDDTRNLMTNVEEIARDDIVENGGSYRDFERRLDFEYRLINFQYMSGLAVSLDMLYDDLGGKINPDFLNIMIVTCFKDWCDAIKTTKMFKSQGVKDIVSILSDLSNDMNKQLTVATKKAYHQAVDDSDTDDFDDDDGFDDDFDDDDYDDDDEGVDGEDNDLLNYKGPFNGDN